MAVHPSRLQLPACRWTQGRRVDSISQSASGLGQYVLAPIRASALRPQPIVSRSRGGSGRLLPGAPVLPEPPALRRLPADLPTLPAFLGTPRPSPQALDLLSPPSFPPELGQRRRRRQRGRQRTAREEAAAAGPVMGLRVRGGRYRLVLFRDQSSGGCGGVVKPEPRGWRGQKRGRLRRERSGAGSEGAAGKGMSRGSQGLGGHGRDCGGSPGPAGGRLGAGSIADEG